MARVLVAVPTFDGGIRPQTFESVANLAWADCDVHYSSVSGYDCAKARTAIAEEVLEGRFDYVLMVDSDVVVPRDALVNLIGWGEPVMLGYYPRQGDFSGGTCLCKPSGYGDRFSGDELVSARRDGAFKVPVRGGGLGCALIRADVFERVKYPWFKFIVYGDRRGTLSEDLYFCTQCRNAGIDIFADARVACGHYFRHIERL